MHIFVPIAIRTRTSCVRSIEILYGEASAYKLRLAKQASIDVNDMMYCVVELEYFFYKMQIESYCINFMSVPI